MKLVKEGSQLVILLALGLLKCDAVLLDTQCLVGEEGVHMNLSSVGIENLPSDVVDSPYVVSLNLSHNRIESISENAFRRLPKLQTLDLSNNKISIKEIFSRFNHSCLTTLKMRFQSKENIRSITPSYGYYNDFNDRRQVYDEKHCLSYLPELKKLDLRGNGKDIMELNLKTIAPNLTHLDLSSNDLETSEFMRGLPFTITHLILDDNKIRDLSTDILNNIEKLSLDENLFTTLCVDDCSARFRYDRYRYNDLRSVTIKARTLKYLHLSGNAIEDIHIKDASAQFEWLELLDLSYNAITQMDPAFKDVFPNLKHLLLNNNQLYTIPNVYAMNVLEHLDLSGNNIRSFSVNSLSVNDNLKNLQLRDNRITVLGRNELNKFPTLTSLDLSNNTLEILRDGWLDENNSLEVLRLTDNRLTNFSSLCLSKLYHLKELHIENNNFSVVYANDVANISENLTIYLNFAKSEDSLE